ncbi:hypothetical protein AK88_02792 [Plasmodium fragile]|uniref:Uncharacterized protein n=1 Tax=Plasmodium fragile TaxID=5857 RepID=A0A0D9QKT3_PLAFR|nr:uncharacterized protein AK88_02792 [Plasmodium fragile]KJP87624.1 hypothetical protein AK88_02792 [Plasmodium fragile]
MEKNKTENGGKENTRLEEIHSLVHISNVVLSDPIKWSKNEGGEYNKESLRQPIYNSLPPPPVVQEINIRDFDQYIRYITKINTLSDVNIRNVDEISLHHFERILNNPPLVEEVQKRAEYVANGTDTQLPPSGGSLSSIADTGEQSNDLSASPKTQSHWEDKHDVLIADEAWCNLSSLTRHQEELSQTLDDIDGDINTLIRKEFQNYLHIIPVLNKLKGEIKNLHDEIKTLSTHVNQVKEMLLKIIHLKKYNHLKRKCKQVNHLLNKFLHFQRLIKMLKKFLQKRKFYHCLFAVNKIFKIYFFFKKKKNFLYFQKYFCNFNISYLKSFLSQNFLFLFFFHSLLFLFRPRRVRKPSLCVTHLVKKWARLRCRSSRIKTDDTTTTQGETPFSDNPAELSKDYTPHHPCLNFSSKDKAQINTFVKFHKRVNEEFMRNIHRKKKKFVKCRKREEENFFVKRWHQGVFSHFYKTMRRRGTFNYHLVHLNNLFTPALFFNNFFNSLRSFCSKENYLKHFVNDLFYGVLHETISTFQRDQFYEFGEKSLFRAEEVAAQSGGEESPSPCEEADVVEVHLHLKPTKRAKPEKTNQPISEQCASHVERYPSGRITLTCEHLVIEKCKTKNILKCEQDTCNNKHLYRQVGLLPIPNLVHFLKNFLRKIKIIQRRINKWASFLMDKIISSLLNETYMESFAKHTPHLTLQMPVNSFPFFKRSKSSHMIKHAYSNLWKCYRDMHHTLFKLLLERISDVLNVRTKSSMHLGINQVISLYWTILPILSFVRRKGRMLRQDYTLLFVSSVNTVLRRAHVCRRMHLCEKPLEGTRPLRVRRTLKRNQFTIAKKVNKLNYNVRTSRRGMSEIGEIPPVCLPMRKEAMCCEDQAHVRSDLVDESNYGLPQQSGQVRAQNWEPFTFNPTGECHPSCFLPNSANLRIGSENFHVPRNVSLAILRRGNREQVKLGRFLQQVIQKTPHGKEIKWRLTHDEKKFCKQITKRIRTESLVAINHFYEFKKIQMDKSLEIEKWNVLEDIPQEINAQMEKYFNIKNEHTNKLCMNDQLFYLTNSSVSFLCIIFQYIHFMLSLPDVSFEIVLKILTFCDKQLLKTVHHFIMDGHAVTNCTLKSITIKILALVIHTLDFADSTLRRVYAIWRHLLCTRRGGAPSVAVGSHMSNHISSEDDIPNAQTNVTPLADHPHDRYTVEDPHRADTQLENETMNVWGHDQLRHPPDKKFTKGERTTISKKTYCGGNDEKSSLEKKEKHTHGDILQGMNTNWVNSVLVNFTKCVKYPTTQNRKRILRGIRLSKQEEKKVKENFKHILDKSFLLKKKLAEKIIDILSTRFDYCTNIWLVSDSLLENHLVNSLSYECDILPYGMQLRSTFKLLSTYLREQDTRNIYRDLFQDIANRFSLRINVLKGNDQYKKIISRLMDDAAPGKSQIDQLIMHYHNYELKEKTAHNIHKNVGDKILIDMTNVLIILYKVPLLSDIIETFLNDFLKICKSHWYVTIDPFLILSKYKK